jgi:hypothetical protein
VRLKALRSVPFVRLKVPPPPPLPEKGSLALPVNAEKVVVAELEDTLSALRMAGASRPPMAPPLAPKRSGDMPPKVNPTAARKRLAGVGDTEALRLPLRDSEGD